MKTSAKDLPVELYGDVYAAAECALSWEGVGVSCGAQTQLWRAIDRLKEMGAPSSAVSSAEKLSVTMHRLTLALRRSAETDLPEAQACKRELDRLGRAWLFDLPIALSLDA